MAKDVYHQIVKESLLKDGWTITHDPYLLSRNSVNKPYEIDLGAEKILIAERGIEHIAVEVKSFLGSSVTYDFHAAFGQYGIYRYFLETKDPVRKLFLAVTEEIYESFFVDIDIENLCEHFNINLIIFDSDHKNIVKWIER
jgi:XisH protein